MALWQHVEACSRFTVLFFDLFTWAYALSMHTSNIRPQWKNLPEYLHVYLYIVSDLVVENAIGSSFISYLWTLEWNFCFTRCISFTFSAHDLAHEYFYGNITRAKFSCFLRKRSNEHFAKIFGFASSAERTTVCIHCKLNFSSYRDISIQSLFPCKTFHFLNHPWKKLQI